MRRKRRSGAVVLLAMLVFSLAPLSPLPAGSTSPSAFVTRSGRDLMVGGQPWHAIGVNHYRATDMVGGYACDPGRGVLTDQELDDLLERARSAGATVLRTWFFQSYYQGQPDRFRAFDRVLAAADTRGLRVIPVLVNNFRSCEPSPVDKTYDFYKSGYLSPGWNYPLSFFDYARTVAAHYANDTRIAFWQLVNEAEPMDQCPSDAHVVLRNFADTMTNALKAVDPNHLVNLGTIGSGQCGTRVDEYRHVHAGAVDICEYHDYHQPTLALPDDDGGFNRLRQRIDQCNALDKPIFVGESAIHAQVQANGDWIGHAVTAETIQRRATFFRAKEAAACSAGVDGYVLWDISREATSAAINGPDYYGIGPGDPSLSVIAPGCTGRAAHHGDYDGDRTTDIAVYRPSTGTWFVRNGANAVWGVSGDIPVPGDYDADGTTDIAVYRPSTGTWFVRNGVTAIWGVNMDVPVPGDHDGDGTTDIAVYRPSTGTWFVRNGANAVWGASGDIPVPGDYNGDGTTDIAVYRPSTGTWFVRNGTNAVWGASTDIALPLPYAIRSAFF